MVAGMVLTTEARGTMGKQGRRNLDVTWACGDGRMVGGRRQKGTMVSTAPWSAVHLRDSERQKPSTGICFCFSFDF